jgi:hypothetical protein
MNTYSYKQDNQAAFGAWFDSIPETLKRDYLAQRDNSTYLLAVLAAADQAPAWIDALVDRLLDTADWLTEYHFNQDLSTERYTVQIDTAAQYGYFQNNNSGTEGGLWFQDNTLIDYDGVFELPKEVHAALTNAGYNLEDI